MLLAIGSVSASQRQEVMQIPMQKQKIWRRITHFVKYTFLHTFQEPHYNSAVDLTKLSVWVIQSSFKLFILQLLTINKFALIYTKECDNLNLD
jgi:hypothetical protein